MMKNAVNAGISAGKKTFFDFALPLAVGTAVVALGAVAVKTFMKKE